MQHAISFLIIVGYRLEGEYIEETDVIEDSKKKAENKHNKEKGLFNATLEKQGLSG